jgi:hypothetical protein
MSPIIDTPMQEGAPGPRPKTARGIYDFAVDGGAIGTIGLMGALAIPLGATIIGGWVEVVTGLTSGGAATAAIQVEGAGDIVPAQVLGTWTVGRKNIVPALVSSAVLSAAGVVRTTAARDISLVIAAFALTAGKFSVVLDYRDPLA